MVKPASSIIKYYPFYACWLIYRKYPLCIEIKGICPTYNNTVGVFWAGFAIFESSHVVQAANEKVFINWNRFITVRSDCASRGLNKKRTVPETGRDVLSVKGNCSI